jgi:hypothetical protein
MIGFPFFALPTEAGLLFFPFLFFRFASLRLFCQLFYVVRTGQIILDGAFRRAVVRLSRLSHLWGSFFGFAVSLPFVLGVLA